MTWVVGGQVMTWVVGLITLLDYMAALMNHELGLHVSMNWTGAWPCGQTGYSL